MLLSLRDLFESFLFLFGETGRDCLFDFESAVHRVVYLHAELLVQRLGGLVGLVEDGVITSIENADVTLDLVFEVSEERINIGLVLC